MSNLNEVIQEDFESYKLPIVSDKNAVKDSSCIQTQAAEANNSVEPRTQYQNNIKHKMYIFFREICLLLFLMFTYAAFQNTIPKSSKSPNAYPFFPVGSIVKDWYYGQLSEAIEIASQSDLAFIMYYAPWDAESQTVREEFSIAAQEMHYEIHFAAINCWHPNSECRQQYNKVYSWPVLMAYPAHGRGIQYRGPRKAEYMLKFLLSVANPFQRINSIVDIAKYQAIHDAAVVAHVNGRLGHYDYGVYYNIALQFLERDPFRDVIFLIYTHVPLNNSKLTLHLWNSSLTYINEWRPDTIMTWISDSLHQVSAWVSPPGGKSESLSSYLQPGPALILFTPKNPLYSNIDYYSVLHDVALDYYNCNNDLMSMALQIRKMSNLFFRKEYNVEYKTLATKCLKSKTSKKDKFSTVVTYDAKKMWLNYTFDCTKHNLKQSLGEVTCIKEDICTKNIVFSKHIYQEQLKKEKEKKDYLLIPLMNKDKINWRLPKNLQYLHEAKSCQYFRLAYELQPARYAPSNYTLDENRTNTTGLACKTNSSLSFLAIDSLQYYYFAEGLGIDILNVRDKSAVVILNPMLETHHIMNRHFNTTNLENFILEFSNGNLERKLSSSVSTRQFTHHYVNQELCQRNTSQVFCVTELNTQNFLPSIMTNNLAVVVMYYSTKCAFCASVSHTLLIVAKILHPVKDLRFARIDGDNHALPWEYSMHHYPNILYFPSRRKSESRVFPQNVPITVTNLLSFILANVDYNIKINAMWALCNQTSFDEDFNSCIRNIKSECIFQIGQLLKVYRLSYITQQRTKLLKHLQHLRSLHFLLENPLRREAIEKHIELIRFIEKVPNQNKSRF